MVKTTNETPQKIVYVQILCRHFRSEIISQLLVVLYCTVAGLLMKVNNWIFNACVRLINNVKARKSKVQLIFIS